MHFTTYFENVYNTATTTYAVKVFVFDSLDTASYAPQSKAEPTTIAY